MENAKTSLGNYFVQIKVTYLQYFVVNQEVRLTKDKSFPLSRNICTQSTESSIYSKSFNKTRLDSPIFDNLFLL